MTNELEQERQLRVEAQKQVEIMMQRMQKMQEEFSQLRTDWKNREDELNKKEQEIQLREKKLTEKASMTSEQQQQQQQRQQLSSVNEVSVVRSVMNASVFKNVANSEIRNNAVYKEEIPFAMAANLVPKFDAESKILSVESWLNRVDEIARAYTWDDVKKNIAARLALTGIAQKWLDGQSGIITWDQLRTRMKEVFGRAILPADIHRAMAKRKRAPNESVVIYAHTMESMGAQGGISDAEIRKYIIYGLTKNSQMRMALLAADSRNDFMCLLDEFEQDERNLTQDKGPPDPRSCYVCDTHGHVARECDQQVNTADDVLICTICELPGHDVDVCPTDGKPAPIMGNKRSRIEESESESDCEYETYP